ncbi:2-dehydropantoate 2-reductase [Mycolicibacterium sp.]|uniref:ketopantoate reductase family protein n=1 Tax=Mycolicibacterium sp. TaxID=2320850 RepID=UPI001A35537A|nr:2-dehydropantoate 2-reductase [Mycolicibacterium sp.]MBJ7341133.1 2-dehydropantoate 2-reductase [Mycolicibacterium sp.]
MRTLIVGAGATGGYLGVQLLRAGRHVTFLVRPKTLSRIVSNGIQVRSGGVDTAVDVNAITTANLEGSYDAVILAVRSDAVASTIDDVRPAVGSGTKIMPVTNGMAHLDIMVAAFGEDVVVGAAAKLATSLLADGTIDEVARGVQLEMGALDGKPSAELDSLATEFGVDGISVTVSAAIRTAMWEKFAFIASTAVLTCLSGDVIGAVARAEGGISLARRVLDEVAAVAAAEGHPIADSTIATLTGVLTDSSSQFAPSMFRDLHAGRPVETSVFADLATRARQHDISTPLLDASIVAINVRQQARAGAAIRRSCAVTAGSGP